MQLAPEEFEQWLTSQRDYFEKKAEHYRASSMVSAEFEAALIERTFSDVLKKYKEILPPPHTLN